MRKKKDFWTGGQSVSQVGGLKVQVTVPNSVPSLLVLLWHYFAAIIGFTLTFI
jgi:hypothetical protein